MKSMRLSADEQARQVLEVQAAWVRAQAAQDYSALDGIAADEFTAVRPDGSVSPREHALATYVRSSDAPPQTLRMEEVDVRLYGKVAVVLSRLQITPQPRARRIVDVLVLRDRRWQLVTEVVT